MKSEISALMDGELDSIGATEAITQLKKRDELRDEWVTYHLIGDALRQSTAVVDITQQVNARLATEPTVLAPRPPMEHRIKVTALSLAASVAAVAIVGWMSLQTMNPPQQNLADNKPVLQTTTQTVPVTVSAPVPAPAQINDYLLAHREFSPRMAIHGAAPNIHPVSGSHESFSR